MGHCWLDNPQSIIIGYFMDNFYFGTLRVRGHDKKWEKYLDVPQNGLHRKQCTLERGTQVDQEKTDNFEIL